MTADDGVRLWVDGQLLVNRWQGQAATIHMATKAMSAGTHQVKVEYYENAGLAVAKVAWAKVTSPPPTARTRCSSGAADIARCSSPGAEATAKLLDGIPGTVYTTGDNVYESGTATEFANCYEPTRDATRRAPGPPPATTSTTRGDGRLLQLLRGGGGPVQGLLLMQFGRVACDRFELDVRERRRVRGDLARDRLAQTGPRGKPKNCTLAYFHQPLFSSGEHGNQTKMRPTWDALYAANADVVLNGHDHDYERFARQSPSGAADAARGIRAFVVGTGGGSHYGFVSVKANSQVRNSDTYGVLKLTLHPGSYDW